MIPSAAETVTTPAQSPLYIITSRRMADVPEEQRPRELFDRHGADNVSDQVLLAIILRSGVQGTSVYDLAGKLLHEYGSLTALAQVSTDELARMKGIGRVKAQVVKSALELGRRLGNEAMPAQPIVRTPEDAARILRGEALRSDREMFWVLLLDKKYRLRRPPVEITSGILDASLVHPREVFKEAIRSASAAVVVLHNHPSGDVTPSAEDLRITRQLVESGKIVDIEVLDHVILGRAVAGQEKDFLSIRESGLVKFSE